MAIYHCSVQMIGRNAGRSAVAAAAYRAGEDIVNEYDGVEHDYTRKKWIEYTKIILPENAPAEYADRGKLWNAVEAAEQSKDAQLCREFVFALPVEMTREQQIKILEQFIQDKLVSKGCVVDYSIHVPPVVNDRHQPIDKNGKVTHDVHEMQFINPHAHVLATIRPIDKNGKWEKKSEIEYLCKHGDEEKGFTAAEFKSAKKTGWEKQYKYYDGQKKIWLPASQGKAMGFERMNPSPKTSRYGRRNEKVEYWNSKDRIFEWRQYWEEVVNAEFARMQSDIRIDNRSFKEQGGEEEVPTLHMGPSASNMEKRAARELMEGKPEALVTYSDIGNINRQIREHNRMVRELKARIDAAVKKAKDFVAAVSEKLEGIRARIIGNKYAESVMARKIDDLSLYIQKEADRLSKYTQALDKTGKANRVAANEIRKLEKKLAKGSGVAEMEKEQIRDKIQELQEQIEYRKEYLGNVGRMCGYASAEEYRRSKTELREKCDDKEQLQDLADKLKTAAEDQVSEYKSVMMAIDPDILGDVDKQRGKSRIAMEKIVQSKLHKAYGVEFDMKVYEEACQKTDAVLENFQYQQHENILERKNDHIRKNNRTRRQ